MNRLPFTALCACCVFFSTPTLAQSGHANHGDHAHGEAEALKPINAMCPIGEEPIEAAGGSTVYKGKAIGFCCPGCVDEFNAWDESKRDAFVAMALAGSEPGMRDEHAQMKEGSVPAEGQTNLSYILSTCPISGEALGSMGDPIVKTYEGREVKFCCQMCVPRFEKDLKASFAKLDQQIIESQRSFYPMTTCVVSGEAFGGEMGDPIELVYNNRLVRLCCKMCKGDFKKDPAAYIAKLDQAVIEQQSEQYPLSACPISGGELGTMGEPISVVYAGRLVKFCCEMCVPKFEADPMPTIKKIDAAWMAMHDED